MTKIPCGRTEEDLWLCCLRDHKWYDTRLKIESIKVEKHPFKRRKLFRISFEIYCRHCGSCIESAGGASFMETLKSYFLQPYW